MLRLSFRYYICSECKKKKDRKKQLKTLWASVILVTKSRVWIFDLGRQFFHCSVRPCYTFSEGIIFYGKWTRLRSSNFISYLNSRFRLPIQMFKFSFDCTYGICFIENSILCSKYPFRWGPRLYSTYINTVHSKFLPTTRYI